MLDYAKIQARADALHRNAKSGTLKLNGETFALTFDAYQGVYNVTNKEGECVVRFNTRKLTIARQWLREYYA